MMKAPGMQLIRLGYWGGAIVLASFVMLLLLPMTQRSNPPDWSIGYFYGLFFTHPVLSAAWAVLGPGPRSIRALGSVVWASATIAFCLLFIWELESEVDGDVVLVIAASIIAQWLILVPIIYILASQYGLAIQSTSDEHLPYGETQSQFGIRHLFILMTGIAFFVGAGRTLLPFLGPSFDLDVVVFLGFFGFAGAITQLPLIVAVLLRRHATLGVLVACIFIAMVTVVEHSLRNALGLGPLNYLILISTNGSSAILVLLVAGMARLHGYLLTGHTRKLLNEPLSEPTND